MGEFDQFKIKEYSLWDLFLHKAQFPYIGRCYAAAKRANAESIIDITSTEAEELLQDVVPAWNDAVKTLYRHDWPNVTFLGNDWRHLHAHLIPRYFEPRVFHGITFIDQNPKGNYAPYPKKDWPLEFLLRIRDEIANAL